MLRTGLLKEAFARQRSRTGNLSSNTGGTNCNQEVAWLYWVGPGTNEVGVAPKVVGTANAALQEAVVVCTLRSGEYKRMVVPTYNRTPKEFEAPFSGGPAAEVLELKSSSEVVLPNPFWLE
jgi:hypothetical protein